LTAVWRSFVDASTATLSPSSASATATNYAFHSKSLLEPELLSRAGYASLPKQAELKPALAVLAFKESAGLFLCLFFVRWLLFHQGALEAAFLSASFVLVYVALSANFAFRYQSLALSDGYLVGPARTFRWRFVRIPLSGLSLAQLDSRSGWSRLFGGAVHLPNPAGPKLWFMPHRYRKHELQDFFSLVRQAQGVAS
jgi:hypothetical protein